VLNPDAFEQLRREVCASGPADGGDNLLGMEIDFCAFLDDPPAADEDFGLRQEMAVHRHEGADWLITGQAKGRRQDAGAIGSELARIWGERLSYQSREGHTIDGTRNHVALRAVTQIAPGGLWVTAIVKVDDDQGGAGAHKADQPALWKLYLT
jgi:hypothetical protein